MTAEAQLERLLWLIAASSDEDGARLDDLAERLDSDVDAVMRDIRSLTMRAFYHRAGDADDLQVLLDDERLRIWTTGELRRPMRLTLREALAMGLGLRMLAARHAPPRAGRLRALAKRLERELAAVDVTALDALHEVDAGADAGGVAAALESAARDRRCCRIEYLKPDAAEAEAREIEPYALIHAGSASYCLARCTSADAVRAFRVDRVLDAVPQDGTFEVPSDFDPEDYLDGGRVYRAESNDAEVEVVVRYSPRVARWVQEQATADPTLEQRSETREDGSMVVHHRVSDPSWVVRHVLGYGAEAEVLEPPAVRAMVVEAVG